MKETYQFYIHKQGEMWKKGHKVHSIYIERHCSNQKLNSAKIFYFLSGRNLYVPTEESLKKLYDEYESTTIFSCGAGEVNIEQDKEIVAIDKVL